MTSSSERTPSQLLKIREVSKMVQVSRSTLYVMINRGHFPGPVRILLRGVRWRESEVLEWIASREKATPDIKMLQME